MTNNEFRRRAVIEAMAGLLSCSTFTDEMSFESVALGMTGDQEKEIHPRVLAKTAHDIAEALLAEEIKRHGEEKWSKEWCAEKAKAEVGYEVGAGYETSDILTQPDWITWNGGKCPVSPDTIVEVERRGGATKLDRAREMRWGHANDLQNTLMDIIRYRVVEG